MFVADSKLWIVVMALTLLSVITSLFLLCEMHDMLAVVM